MIISLNELDSDVACLTIVNCTSSSFSSFSVAQAMSLPRKVPAVERHLEDTFKVILDEHTDIGLVAFILYQLRLVDLRVWHLPSPNVLLRSISSFVRAVEEPQGAVAVVSFHGLKPITVNATHNRQSTRSLFSETKDVYRPSLVADMALYNTLLSQVTSFASPRWLVFHAFDVEAAKHEVDTPSPTFSPVALLARSCIRGRATAISPSQRVSIPPTPVWASSKECCRSSHKTCQLDRTGIADWLAQGHGSNSLLGPMTRNRIFGFDGPAGLREPGVGDPNN
ncbi:uncharacterized protein HD556DRAFT_1303889 [Suillus plorans]|uniref:Uncharacterized protein n=1 Tax=Suillus plorans TaxID=116603 RepID=A0A9P7J5Q2_9AGAM|nr:uncharacterized protein HD556DRAFT_1303889 [Suillus plorans]KAG1803906.1 hypothetical protein HD556DRAFT_1303889 [Suillus plorans]